MNGGPEVVNRQMQCRATALSLILWLVVGCAPHTTPPTKAVAPAKVEKLPQETELARITLTPQAEQRLGITLGVVSRESVQRRRTFGGDVMVPAGQSIVVSAPVAGTIAAPERAAIPLPGQHVAVGEPILMLAPLLSPERDVPTPAERVQMANSQATLLAAHMVAKGDVERGRAELETAQVTLNRAQQLLSDKVGSAKAVDDARTVEHRAVNPARGRAAGTTIGRTGAQPGIGRQQRAGHAYGRDSARGGNCAQRYRHPRPDGVSGRAALRGRQH